MSTKKKDLNISINLKENIDFIDITGQTSNNTLTEEWRTDIAEAGTSNGNSNVTIDVKEENAENVSCNRKDLAFVDVENNGDTENGEGGDHLEGGGWEGKDDFEGDDNVDELSDGGDENGGEESDILRQSTLSETTTIGVIKNFFYSEKEMFNEERKKYFWDMDREDITLDFGKIYMEWEDLRRNWRSKKEGNEFFFPVVVGLVFTVIPNCLIVLDYTAAYQYLNGTFYPTLSSGNLTGEHCLQYNCSQSLCSLLPANMSCFIRDPIYGYLTLTLTFSGGFFWSFIILHQYWTYLRKTKKIFKKKRMFLAFIPVACVSLVSFPVQLLIISLLSCINDQEQWMILTVKVGTAEG